MAGLLDRAGMDASGMMGKMSKALVSLAQPGETAAEAYQRVLSEMEGYIEAGDEAAAMDLATELFGTRGAAQFVGAVQSGALAMDDLRDASLGAGEGIMGTYEATASWPEKWELLKNKAKEFLEPLAGALMDGLGMALDKLNEVMDSIDPSTLEGVASTLTELFEALIAAVTNLWTALQPLVTFLMDTFVGGVIPAIEAALLLLSGDFDGARAKIGQALEGVKTIVNNAKTAITQRFEAIRTSISGKVDAIKSAVKTKFDEIKKSITQPIEDAKGAVSSAIQNIKDAFNVTLSFPHIKLPHFRITGGEVPWGIGGKGTAPSIAIDWYAKGGFVDGATLIGVGEQGAEMVWPSYEPYLSKYAQAIAADMPTQDDLLGEVRSLRDDVRNLKVYLDTGALVGGISRQMDGSLGRRQLMAGRGVV